MKVHCVLDIRTGVCTCTYHLSGALPTSSLLLFSATTLPPALLPLCGPPDHGERCASLHGTWSPACPTSLLPAVLAASPSQGQSIKVKVSSFNAAALSHCTVVPREFRVRSLRTFITRRADRKAVCVWLQCLLSPQYLCTVRLPVACASSLDNALRTCVHCSRPCHERTRALDTHCSRTE